MNDVEVQSICDYLEECLFEPSINWPPEQFAERSYSRWAVSEILDRVRGIQKFRLLVRWKYSWWK